MAPLVQDVQDRRLAFAQGQQVRWEGEGGAAETGPG